jgi:hypothetical protein
VTVEVRILLSDGRDIGGLSDDEFRRRFMWWTFWSILWGDVAEVYAWECHYGRRWDARHNGFTMPLLKMV